MLQNQTVANQHETTYKYGFGSWIYYTRKSNNHLCHHPAITKENKSEFIQSKKKLYILFNEKVFGSSRILFILHQHNCIERVKKITLTLTIIKL